MSEVLSIASLDLEARGIARREGKTIFVQGALPGEVVEAITLRKKPSYEIARTERVLKESSLRVKPRCPNFGMCGGCAMQHLDTSTQVAVKQRALEECFLHISKLKIPQVLAPMHGPDWGYRYRARLSVRYVRKKGAVLVGFHERKSGFIADMTECHILPKHISDLLLPLRALIGNLSLRERVPQIEVAVGDDVTVLTMRHMDPFTENDLVLLDAFADKHHIIWWVQSKGPETVKPLHEKDVGKLAYSLPQFGLRMAYKPTDFTQVNHQINQTLIARALNLLGVQPEDRVADLFCGLGNFTLPLATQVREVVGIEGSKTLTDRALEASKAHGLDHKARFSTLNLFEVDVQWLRDLGYFDRMLIDPPREGALEVVKALAQLVPGEKPKRIVYVSCNPATLARDAGVLVEEGAYKLISAGVINMFPHTAHVESIAVFES